MGNVASTTPAPLTSSGRLSRYPLQAVSTLEPRLALFIKPPWCGFERTTLSWFMSIDCSPRQFPQQESCTMLTIIYCCKLSTNKCTCQKYRVWALRELMGHIMFGRFQMKDFVWQTNCFYKYLFTRKIHILWLAGIAVTWTNEFNNFNCPLMLNVIWNLESERLHHNED